MDKMQDRIRRDRRKKNDLEIKRVIDEITQEELDEVKLTQLGLPASTISSIVLMIALVVSCLIITSTVIDVATDLNSTLGSIGIGIFLTLAFSLFSKTKILENFSSSIGDFTDLYRANYKGKDIDIEANSFMPQEEIKRLIILMWREKEDN